MIEIMTAKEWCTCCQKQTNTKRIKFSQDGRQGMSVVLCDDCRKELIKALGEDSKAGHWIYDYTTADGHKTYHCSECGCYLKPKHCEPLNSFKWCSLCGTKMEGKVDE